MVKTDFLGGAEPTHRPPSRLAAARTRLHLGLLATDAAARGKSFYRLRYSAALLGVSGVVGALFLRTLGAADAADVLALRLLAYASWLYGLVGLRALLAPMAPSPLIELGLLRGRASASGERALGIALRLASGVFLSALPGVLMALLVVPSSRLILARALLLPLTALYAAGLGVTLASIGVFSERLAPRWPRWTAAALILGPYLMSLAWPALPSVPGFFGLLLERLLALGGSAGL